MTEDLDDVLFYRHAFKGERYPPNEMVNVDFSRARFRHVGFRGLALDRVRLPNDDEHLVLKDFAVTLDQMLVALKHQTDPIGKKLTAFIGIEREEAVRNQVQGSINLSDLADCVGEEGVKRFVAAIPPDMRIEA